MSDTIYGHADLNGTVTEEHTPDALTTIDFDGRGEFSYGETKEEIAADNLRRAGFAVHALIAYAERVNTLHSGEDIATILSDLLGDFRHLCDAIGADFSALSERGYHHYSAEIAGEI